MKGSFLLLAALLGAAVPALGGERPAVPAAASAAAGGREVASDGVPMRAATERRHDRYDRQGNALDRRGRILAAPATGNRPHEVFSDD